MRAPSALSLVLLPLMMAAGTGCRTLTPSGVQVKRHGDEIVATGQFFRTGTPVVLWLDTGGYDAYRVERRFSAYDKSDWKTSSEEAKDLKTPNRYSLREKGLTEAEIQRVRGGGWDLPLLQRTVDQFVLHFDVCGVSRQCFNVLHDHRDLSVHFMLDLDGTIYQTLDLKERAWHATTSNTRSIGIEIANMGAYASGEAKALEEWYGHDARGVRITIPERMGDGGIRTPNFIGRPARPDLVWGNVQGRDLAQYDYTPQQYAALIKLTAALCKIFPRIKCDYPRDADGKLIPRKLEDAELQRYGGVLGHYHIQTNKTDPGPALQWDKVMDGAKRLLNGGMTDPVVDTSAGHMRPKS